MQQYTLDFYKQSADYLLAHVPARPEIGMILGSALGGLAEELEDKIDIDYRDIPNFLLSTVESHAGKMIFGTLAGKRVVAMSGRFHYYEGYSFEQLAAPVRVMKLLGVEKLIVTNAAGGINTGYSVGDIMIIRDHINFAGVSPQRGPNVPELGPRFFDMSKTYTPALRELAAGCAARLGQQQRTREGVYFFFVGPHFETPSEIAAARLLGGDAAGMSTVTEALTAGHCGMQVLGFSLISNMAAGVLDQPITAEEVDEAGREASVRFKALIREVVKEM